MHRALRVGEYWNWLPAFRAVAETKTLREAAQRLHVAPSAISRTVRLLESSLKYPLFARANGALTLNAAGRHLLEAVRDAMRIVNEANDGPRRHDGPCHIHCPPDVVPLLLGSLETWAAAHTASPPLVHVPCAEDVAAQLLRGDLDVALAFEQTCQAGLDSMLLGELSSSLYCSPTHPARRLGRVTEEEFATLPFIDYPVGELAFLRVMRNRENQRVAYVPTMHIAVQLCVRGLGLVCVPDFVVRDAGAGLVRLPFKLPLARLFAWYRRPISADPPLIVEHLAGSAEFSSLVIPPGTSKRERPPADRSGAERARTSARRETGGGRR